MKKILLSLVLLGNIAWAQTKSCCQMTVTDQNNTLAMNDNFAQTHLVPAPYDNPNHSGKMIEFDTRSEKGSAYLVKTSNQKSNNVIIIFHEWWGLNDYIKQEADEYAKDFPDADIYAIDLYDKKVAFSVETAQKYMSGLNQERVNEIIYGLLKRIGPGKKIVTLGWCLGGAWSLQASMMATRQAIGCVMYYGMPESDINRLKMLNCDVLGIFANEDQFINAEVVNSFEENMRKADKKLTVFKYPADHAFANPSNPKHNKELSAEARSNVVEYMKAKFK
jgi:carboxymethylenebutenolidase